MAFPNSDRIILILLLCKTGNLNFRRSSQLARLVIAKRRGVSDETERECLASVKNAISKSARRFSGNEQHVRTKHNITRMHDVTTFQCVYSSFMLLLCLGCARVPVSGDRSAQGRCDS